MKARAKTRGAQVQWLVCGMRDAGKHVDDMNQSGSVSSREACAAVTVSSQNWKRSDRRDKKSAFSVYVAALDGEEQAATAYQRAVAQVATS